jgi:hypothetical protein
MAKTMAQNLAITWFVAKNIYDNIYFLLYEVSSIYLARKIGMPSS